MPNNNSFLIVFLFLNSLLPAAGAAEIPSLPPNPCYENCTEYMQELVNDFTQVGVEPSLTPTVYSGECRHLGQYDPMHVHYAVVMIDQVENRPNFSTIFSFFAEENEFSNWNLDISRNEMSDYWKKNGVMKFEDGTARTEILYDDGAPAYIYWMRQNPVTQQLLYITYAGFSMKSFCRLDKNSAPAFSVLK